MRPLHGHTNDKRKESLTTEVKQMKLDYVNIFLRAVPFFVTKTRGKKYKKKGGAFRLPLTQSELQDAATLGLKKKLLRWGGE